VVGFRNIAPHPDGIHDADVSWQGFGQIAKGVGGRRGEIQFAYINGNFPVSVHVPTNTNHSPRRWICGVCAFNDLEEHSRVANTRSYLWVHPDGSVDAWLNGRVAYEDYNDHGWIPQGQIAGGIGLTGACVRFADLSGGMASMTLGHISHIANTTRSPCRLPLCRVQRLRHRLCE